MQKIDLCTRVHIVHKPHAGVCVHWTDELLCVMCTARVHVSMSSYLHTNWSCVYHV